MQVDVSHQTSQPVNQPVREWVSQTCPQPTQLDPDVDRGWKHWNTKPGHGEDGGNSWNSKCDKDIYIRDKEWERCDKDVEICDNDVEIFDNDEEICDNDINVC